MKVEELRASSDKDLKTKLKSLADELLNLRFQSVVGQIKNPLKKKLLRKDIARIKTIRNEKKRGK